MPAVQSSSSSRRASVTQLGEDPQVTAARELQEEVELKAEHWHLLLTLLPTAGSQQRAAPHLPCRGLSHSDRGDFELHAEEAELEVLWVAFDDLLDAVLQQQVREGPLVAAVLAYEVLRRRDEL